MTIANADIDKMERFLGHLRKFDNLLADEFRSMLGHWRELGGVWTDAKYHQLGQDLEDAARGIERYLAVADGHEDHLARLIQQLEAYLKT